MKVAPLGLPGVLRITPTAYPDERGFFVESWRSDRYLALGVGPFVQDNHSRSRRGVLRGLHFQVDHPQGKLLHVARGVIFDVVVELRSSSPDFCRFVAVVLRDGEQLWVPPGYAHGFCVLSEEADVLYRCTEVWHPDDAAGVRWDDPTLAIPWPVADPLLSAADAALPLLAEAVRLPPGVLMRFAVLLVTSLTGCVATDADGEPVPDPARTFRVALLSDPHITASDYVCCENSELDTESIYRTSERLIAAQDKLAAISPQPELALLAGDVFHQNYKHPAVADYLDRETAAGNAADLLERFAMPAYPAWGNHDYEVPEFSRDFSHELFRELFGREPYEAVVHRGWKFILANSQLGQTWDTESPAYDTSFGSLGAEQLAWIDAELNEGLPTFILLHHALFLVKDGEVEASPDLEALVNAHHDVVQAVFVGHTHRWIDLSDSLGLPHMILAATRYDEDNFLVAELTEDSPDWRLLDRDKAVWGNVEGRTFDYDAMEVVE